jgi:hypothetical protein
MTGIELKGWTIVIAVTSGLLASLFVFTQLRESLLISMITGGICATIVIVMTWKSVGDD